MSKIEIENKNYRVHPIYDLYAASEDGKIIHIKKQIPITGRVKKNGYVICSVRKFRQTGQKKCYVHLFVWECYNGLIPDGKVIDHINDDKKDNLLCNLQLMSQQQNCKKSAKKRDYTFAKYDHQNKKCVKVINCTTKEVTYYNSMYALQQKLQINAGIVKMVCEQMNYCKTGISKKDGCSYRFEYIKKEDLPENFVKSANKRAKRVSDEDKKETMNKEYKCLRCDKILKHKSKYAHKKKCNRQKQ